MAIFITSDSHFNGQAIINTLFRPFKTIEEMSDCIINKWNEDAKEGDTIYHLGDFVNYNRKEPDKEKALAGLKLVQKINADVVLIVGNNEDRIIHSIFNDDPNAFKRYCLEVGFKDVLVNKVINLDGKDMLLTHCPDCCRDDMLTIFGHIHTAAGLYLPCGINVTCDLYHFKLVSEDMLREILEKRKEFWNVSYEEQMTHKGSYFENSEEYVEVLEIHEAILRLRDENTSKLDFSRGPYKLIGSYDPSNNGTKIYTEKDRGWLKFDL